MNECFKKSINRDPNYLNAQINHACTYILSGNYALAIGIVNQIIDNKKYQKWKYNLSKSHTIRAIAYYFKNQNDLSKDNFEKAKYYQNVCRTRYNLKIFNELNKDIFDDFMEYIGLFDEPDKEKNYGPEKLSNPYNEKINKKSANVLNLMNTGQFIVVPSEPELKIKYSSSK